MLGEMAVGGCLLTKIDATEAQLELRFQATDAASRDSQRAAVMLRLDQRFAATGQSTPAARRPTFA